MSIELWVATGQPYSVEAVVDWARQRGLHATVERGRVVIGVLNADMADASIEVFGPSPATRDSDELLAEVVPEPRWLVQIGVEDDRRADLLELVTDLADHLAATFKGAVYSPQLNEIVTDYVSRQTKLTKRGAGTSNRPAGKRVDSLSLLFVFSADRAEAMPLELLPLIGELTPELMPERYGAPPNERRFEGSSALNDFVAAWKERLTVDADTAPALYWACADPMFGGHLFRSPDDGKPEGVKAMTEVLLSLDGTAAEMDSSTRERYVELFRTIATRLGPVYGEGYLERDLLLTKHELVVDRNESIDRRPIGPWFYGVPPTPTWLAWFGRGYRELLGGALVGHYVAEVDGGFLIRRGERPLDRRQLPDRAPIPEQFVVRELDEFTLLPAHLIPS